MEIILGLIIFPWPDIHYGVTSYTLHTGLDPPKAEAGGGVGGDRGGQCVSPEAAKDSDQGGHSGGDAKEKGEPGRRLRGLRDRRGLVARS